MSHNTTRRNFLIKSGIGLVAIVAAATGVGVLYKQHVDKIEKPKKPEKNVFIYSQESKKENLQDVDLSASNYWCPHIYDISNSKGGVKLKYKINSKSIDDLVQKAHSSGNTILPMLSAFNDDAIKAVISNPDYFAEKIAAEVKFKKYDGITIDFESTKLNSNYSRQMVDFMRKLRNQLKEGKYEIALAVSPRFEGSSQKGYSHHGFYDFKGLSKYVDHMHLMCYDFHSKKGKPSPVLPEDSLVKILEYAKENIPNEKITVLLPFYGYVWKKRKSKKQRRNGSLSANNVDNYVEKHGVKKSEIRNGEVYIETRDSYVYAQTPEVFKRRFQILDTYGIKSIGGWRSSHLNDEISQTIKDEYKR